MPLLVRSNRPPPLKERMEKSEVGLLGARVMSPPATAKVGLIGATPKLIPPEERTDPPPLLVRVRTLVVASLPPRVKVDPVATSKAALCAMFTGTLMA